MPEALPERIDRPSAWIGAELAGAPEQWQHRLTADEIDELEAAAHKFMASGRSLSELRAGDFSLPEFNRYLLGLRERLTQGLGFEVISGLPVDRLETALIDTIFCGIGAHLGNPRPQNAAGDLLGHVRDVGRDPNDPEARIYQTSARQTFHTDSADVVGLLCLRQAQSGGDSLLVSAETLYNELHTEDRDLAAALFEIVATDRRGEVPNGADPWFEIPVLNWHTDLLSVQYQRQYIESAQRFPEAPRLTQRHRRALDAFDRLANDPSLHLTMRLEPGDMQFVYNHALLHDRTAFVDHPEPRRRRHLLRLWLSLPDDRPLPACYASRYGNLTPGARGGVVVDLDRSRVTRQP